MARMSRDGRNGRTGTSSGLIRNSASLAPGLGTGSSGFRATGSSITVPGTPTSVAASASGSTVTVTWTAPSSGGSSITSYTIQRSPDSTNWTTVSDTDGNATNATATLTSQANGTYTYRVAATNSVGTGSYGVSGSVVVSSGSVPGAPSFVSGPVFSGLNVAETDRIDEQVTATGTGIIDYEFVFLLNNSVQGTRTLTKAQAEAAHAWARTDTATTFRMAYTDGTNTGPAYVFTGLSAASRASSTSGVRVRARNSTGYSTSTFSAGTGSIEDGGD